MRSRLLCAALLIGLGCQQQEPPAKAAPFAAATQLRGKPRTKNELPTTHHRIFLANLEGRFDALQATARDAGAHAPPGLHLDLARLHRSRFAYARDYTDLESAVQHANAALAGQPDDPETLVVVADLAVHTHEFDQASELIAHAKKRGASQSACDKIQREIDWATGRRAAAEDTIREMARAEPSVHTLTRLAILEHELGNASAAEATFERAEDHLVDTSPYTLAWLYFLRGRTLVDRAQVDRAIPFFRAAIDRLPPFVDPQIALAEALRVKDPRAPEALKIYRALARSNQHAAVAALAEIAPIAERGEHAQRAQKILAEIEKRFPKLAESHLQGKDIGLPQAHEILMRQTE